jgi:hypothetical protein
MSYDVDLLVEGVIAKVARHEEGGTYALGGTENAELNITYNYAEVYKLVPLEAKEKAEAEDDTFGVRWLNNRTVAETMPILERAVKTLGTSRFNDYWAPTPGNAGYALSILVCWGKQHPNGVWAVQ